MAKELGETLTGRGRRDPVLGVQDVSGVQFPAQARRPVIAIGRVGRREVRAAVGKTPAAEDGTSTAPVRPDDGQSAGPGNGPAEWSPRPRRDGGVALHHGGSVGRALNTRASEGVGPCRARPPATASRPQRPTRAVPVISTGQALGRQSVPVGVARKDRPSAPRRPWAARTAGPVRGRRPADRRGDRACRGRISRFRVCCAAPFRGYAASVPVLQTSRHYRTTGQLSPPRERMRERPFRPVGAAGRRRLSRAVPAPDWCRLAASSWTSFSHG